MSTAEETTITPVVIAMTPKQTKAVRLLAGMASKEVFRHALHNVAFWRSGASHVILEATDGACSVRLRLEYPGICPWDDKPFALVNAQQLIKALPTAPKYQVTLSISDKALTVSYGSSQSIVLLDDDSMFPAMRDVWKEPEDQFIEHANFDHRRLAKMTDIVSALTNVKESCDVGLMIRSYGKSGRASVISLATDNFAGILMPLSSDAEKAPLMPSWAIGGRS